MSYTLIIAEKEKAAKAIGDAIRGSSQMHTVNQKSYSKIFEIPSRRIVIIPLRGHIKEFRNVGRYIRWKGTDPREIITNPHSIAKVEKEYAKPYIRTLQKFASLSNKVIIATDADNEGCNIGLLDALPYIKEKNSTIEIKQLWLNDLQKETILNAMRLPIEPKWSWAYSAEARALIDAIIGFSATREITLTLSPFISSDSSKTNASPKKGKFEILSIGRVQTALLYLIYLNEREIRDFVPEKYWTLYAEILMNGVLLGAHYKNNPIHEKKEAERILNVIKKEKFAILLSHKSEKKKILPPTPLNTSKALILLTSLLKIKAKTALKTLEDLYLDKIISYPRTDSDKYSSSYNHRKILLSFQKDPEFGAKVSQWLNENKKPRNGKKNLGDHSPITPLKYVPKGSSLFKTPLHEKVYDIVKRIYLSLFAEPAEELVLHLEWEIRSYPFTSRLSGLNKEGFLKITPFKKKSYHYTSSQILSILKEIEEKEKTQSSSTYSYYPIKNVSMEEKNTEPKKRYTESEILKKMEQNNLGTKSTRPEIIQKIIDRNYVVRQKNTLYITPLGFSLIEMLDPIWHSFLIPEFTAHIETILTQIQEERITYTYAVEQVRSSFLSLFDEFRKNKIQLTKFFIEKRKEENQKKKEKEKTTRSSGSQKEDITPLLCPRCKTHYMILVKKPEIQHNSLRCSNPNCNHILYLPKKGTPSVLKSKCKICGFNIVKITRRTRNKYSRKTETSHYYLCPTCWNNYLKTSQEPSGMCHKCKDFLVEKGRCKKKEK